MKIVITNEAERAEIADILRTGIAAEEARYIADEAHWTSSSELDRLSTALEALASGATSIDMEYYHGILINERLVVSLRGCKYRILGSGKWGNYSDLSLLIKHTVSRTS